MKMKGIAFGIAMSALMSVTALAVQRIVEALEDVP